MEKIINPCNVLMDGVYQPMFCKIAIKDGKLSISGVVGPKRNGNCYGSCGQIDMGFDHLDKSQNDRRTTYPVPVSDLQFQTGWDSDIWYKFLDAWHKWHLNDMKPSCIHQESEGWGGKEVTVVDWWLNEETRDKINKIKEKTLAALTSGGVARISREERILLGLPSSFNGPEKQPVRIKKLYREYKRETKTTGWVRPKEHPEGVLGKPCPTCGYKYGSEWQTRELPAEVVGFLQGLPDTTRTPAWV